MAVLVGLLALLALIGGLAVYFYVGQSNSSRLYDDVAEIPYNRVGLLLGTNPKGPSGGPNYYFTYRIDACVALYEAGKIEIVLISGDNHVKSYNEPQAMKDALVARGIPASSIVLDYAGFRTLDSVVRAREVFGQEKMTLISQRYHNERAVFLARHYGIDAIGYNAREIRSSRTYLEYGFLREALARVKMFVDLLVDKQPKFLGEKIPV